MLGTVVAVTGARRSSDLVEAFARRGATVRHAPLVSGDQPVGDAEIARATQAVLDLSPTWVVASTGVGMRLWLESAARSGHRDALVRLLSSARCLARGPKAAGGLGAVGVRPLWTAPEQTDAAVATWLSRRAGPGEGVAVQQHGGHPHAYDVLAPGGIEVVSVTTYRTGSPTDVPAATALVAAVLSGDVDVVTLTSPGAVRGLVDIARRLGGAERLQDLSSTTLAVAAVGPVTAEACAELGLRVRIQPSRFRSMDLVREVDRWVAGGPRCVL